MADKTQAVRDMLRDVLAPLLEKDGGELYLVSVDKKELKLHLAGSWSGSPAVVVTVNRVIEPAVRAVAGRLKVSVSSGWRVPEGAERMAES